MVINSPKSFAEQMKTLQGNDEVFQRFNSAEIEERKQLTQIVHEVVLIGPMHRISPVVMWKWRRRWIP